MISSSSTESPRTVFFRNDDLGWMQPEFNRLAELFLDKNMKFTAAAIPMSCLEIFKPGSFKKFESVLDIHTHGFTHLDFQGAGKKSEFGSARKKSAVESDLNRSVKIMSEVFGSMASPIFTPPWNRFEKEYIPFLINAGYRAISTDGEPRFIGQDILELNVQIDLHTDKKNTHTFLSIMDYIKKSSSPVGIMLHHKYMMDKDFTFLTNLLDLLNEESVRVVFMRELLP